MPARPRRQDLLWSLLPWEAASAYGARFLERERVDYSRMSVFETDIAFF